MAAASYRMDGYAGLRLYKSHRGERLAALYDCSKRADSEGWKDFPVPGEELEELRGGAVTKTQEQGESLDVSISSDVIIKIDDPENLHLCVDHDLHIVYKKADQIFKIEFAPGSPLGGGRTMRGVALESLERYGFCQIHQHLRFM